MWSLRSVRINRFPISTIWQMTTARYAYDYYHYHSVIFPGSVGFLKNVNFFNRLKAPTDFFRDVVERILQERRKDTQVKEEWRINMQIDLMSIKKWR